MDLTIYSFLTNFLNKKADKVVGQIVPVICMDDYIPNGTLPCNGQFYDKQDYPTLWNKYLIGTKPKYYAWVSSTPSITVWTKTETPIALDTVPLLGSVKYTDSHYTISAVGSETQITVTYTPDVGDAVNYTCIRQTSSDEKDHLLPTCSEAEYQDFLLNYGQCPVWTINSELGQFRTPHIKDKAVLQQAMYGSELGKAYNAGLPDIVARMSNESGAIDNSIGSGSGNWENKWWRASAWNPIYGASDTVQPVAVSVRYFVVI